LASDPAPVDAFDSAFIGQLLALIEGPRRPVVLIDGRSGSGKTELGTALALRLGAQLVSLDDVYPGWDGLEAASELVRTDILIRHRWQRWDWQSDAPAEWHEVDPDRALVVEGSGALSRANRELASFGIWVELDEPTRKARALARDGAMYRPHWDAWALQEQRFFDRERPDRIADLVVPG
jgi:cytidylate kinase